MNNPYKIICLISIFVVFSLISGCETTKYVDRWHEADPVTLYNPKIPAAPKLNSGNIPKLTLITPKMDPRFNTDMVAMPYSMFYNGHMKWMEEHLSYETGLKQAIQIYKKQVDDLSKKQAKNQLNKE